MIGRRCRVWCVCEKRGIRRRFDSSTQYLGFVVTYFLGGFKAVCFWHLHIHQRQVKALGHQAGNGLAPIRRNQRLMSAFFEQANHQPLIYWVVLCDKDSK